MVLGSSSKRGEATQAFGPGGLVLTHLIPLRPNSRLHDS